MVPDVRPSAMASKVVRDGEVDHIGPASIYRAASRPPVVSLATFTRRYRRLAVDDALTAERIDEALSLTADEFKQMYATRRTYIQVEGRKTDLTAFYVASPVKPAVGYRNFWQRVRALVKSERLSQNALTDALHLDAAGWRSFYGGGRRRGFVYEGDEYPEHSGRQFHSATAFLRTVGRYADRALIWSRLKNGWALDDALAVPIASTSHRTGSIYRVSRRKTGAVYVGLTVTTVEQRWVFHVRRAAGGSSTRLHAAIREDGPEGFDVDVLESGIPAPALLPAREAYWADRLDALGPMGLNTAKPGGLGSSGGKAIQYGEVTFRSIEEAAEVLSKRLGIARHVLRSRLQQGQPLPQAERVRRHSSHPDAGSNLFRRWLGMLKRHPHAVSTEWAADYDRFKEDVSPVPLTMELVRKRPEEAWGPCNFEWVSTQSKIERTHGTTVTVNGIAYPSLKAVASTHGIGVSTLKNRIAQQGMTVEEAIAAPLGVTSYKQASQAIAVDGLEFRSKRRAILHISVTRGIPEHQAKYRYETGNY